jgi:ankyrin repeat protein
LTPLLLTTAAPVIEVLVKRGADMEAIDTSNGGSDTALLRAMARSAYPIVELLLQLGADVNATRSDGRTCLHIAASRGNQAMCEKLLAYGAVVEEAVDEVLTRVA